ncbi:hypothetical protein FB451DRAFT_1363119 [Mycena latifolia]|nr:hypothetical protein FB451DRAFT_1363119 [Mycena latifolia]
MRPSYLALLFTTTLATASPLTPRATDPQTSFTLDSAVNCTNCASNGSPTTGETASLTTLKYLPTPSRIPFTHPNFIPTTSSTSRTGASCNPIPMGLIPASTKMPSVKFNFPRNNDTINANVDFFASLNVANLHTGIFTNPASNYFAAPQTLDSTGLINGYSSIVVERLTAFNQILPPDPTMFVFFKAVLDPVGSNGELSVEISGGLPAGIYRICSIISAANHQAVNVPIAQHGSLNDCAYFTAK